MLQENRDVEKELAESLKKLAVEKPFEKITIKQIADGAGVIRVTFYNHFQDKYDLLAWIVRKEIFDPIRILFSNYMYREALKLLFTNLLKDRDFYRKAEKITGQNSFAEIVTDCAENLLIDILRDRGADKRIHSRLTPEDIARYYANSMCYILMGWIREGMTIPPEDMVEIYEKLNSLSLRDLLYGEE